MRGRENTEVAGLGQFRLWLRNVARTECVGASLLWIGHPLTNTLMVVVCFLLGDSPASDLYMQTFRNTLSVPSSKAGVK